jgi:glycosyltransferase involved in cell wall biosynthesis
MRKLLTFFGVDSLFANAGQAVVERLTLRNLANSGTCAVRVVAVGDGPTLQRLKQFYRDEISRKTIEIIAFPPENSLAVLDDISLIYLHSMQGWILTRWLMKHNIWLSRPTLQFVHSFALTPAEQFAWGAWWAPWKGSPPCRLVAPSEVTARRIRSIAGTAAVFGGGFPEVVVVPHGVDADIGMTGNREGTRAALNYGANTKAILSLARLSPEKLAYRQMIVALSILRDRRPEQDFRLVLVGGVAPQDRQYVANLQNLADQRGLTGMVSIEEHATEQRKQDLLAAADLFVSPACHPQESFGLALLEAMAAGLPIVASDWNGYREVMPEAYRPYLVPTIADHESARNLEYVRLGDACAVDFTRFISILDQITSDRPLADALIAAGRLQAQTLSWRHTTSRILELVDLLLEESRSGKAGTPVLEDGGPLGSPVAELATVYLAEDTLLRYSAIGSEIHGVPLSAVGDLVVRLLKERRGVRLRDLAEPFQGDVLLRNRVVMQLLRWGQVMVVQPGDH